MAQVLKEEIGTSASISILKQNEKLVPSEFVATATALKEIDTELGNLVKAKLRVAREIIENASQKSSGEADFLRGLNDLSIQELQEAKEKYEHRSAIVSVLLTYKNAQFVSKAVNFIQDNQDAFVVAELAQVYTLSPTADDIFTPTRGHRSSASPSRPRRNDSVASRNVNVFDEEQDDSA